MMKLHYISILTAALALMVCFSCKKKEETKESLTGTMKVDHNMDSYVKSGDTFTFSPGGVTAPDGTGIGYYFTAPITGIKDTLRAGATYSYEVPDTTGTFILTCTAYPIESSDKYYVKSGTITFVIVSETKTLTGLGRHLDDYRVWIDGQEYYVQKIAGQEWMRNNLRTIRRDDNGREVFGHSFANSPAMQNIFGGYYTWEEAQTACPEGWRLPSESDWVNLLKTVGAPDSLKPMETSPSGAGKLMVKAYFNGTVMWDYYRAVNIKDEAISAIPVGYANITGDQYEFTGDLDYAAFWTSDEYGGKGVYRYIYKEYDNVFVGTASNDSFAANVRCIK